LSAKAISATGAAKVMAHAPSRRHHRQLDGTAAAAHIGSQSSAAVAAPKE
jgi:hypothetical protein